MGSILNTPIIAPNKAVNFRGVKSGHTHDSARTGIADAGPAIVRQNCFFVFNLLGCTFTAPKNGVAIIPSIFRPCAIVANSVAGLVYRKSHDRKR